MISTVKMHMETATIDLVTVKFTDDDYEMMVMVMVMMMMMLYPMFISFKDRIAWFVG
jgi:hypothetical protein